MSAREGGDWLSWKEANFTCNTYVHKYKITRANVKKIGLSKKKSLSRGFQPHDIIPKGIASRAVTRALDPPH